jgi:hypothetical protein
MNEIIIEIYECRTVGDVQRGVMAYTPSKFEIFRHERKINQYNSLSFV